MNRDELIAFIRTRALGEHIDRHGQTWLLWNDRAVLLIAYEATR